MITGGRRYDKKIDVWSFGIFVVELAQGEPPYIVESQERVLYNIANNPSPTIDASRWSPKFCDFAAKCLKKDPEERHTIDQLLNHEWLAEADNQKESFLEAYEEWKNSEEAPITFDNL